MGEIQVGPEELAAAGSAVAGIGSELTGLGGQVNRLSAGQEAAQPSTAEALGEFAQAWSRGLAELGTSVRTFGAATCTAGARYTETDRSAVPAGTPDVCRPK